MMLHTAFPYSGNRNFRKI